MNQKERGMKQKTILLLSILTLLLYFILSVSLRAYIFRGTFSGFIPYSAESASHFYYAQRLQEHKKIPRLDKTIQYPEGCFVFRKTSIFMEYIVAWLYNHLPHKVTQNDFQSFTRFSMPLFYSFSIFAIFLSAFALTGQASKSLLAAALLVFSRASIERSSGFEFLSENFSLPFIFFHFAFVLTAFQSRKKQTLFFLLSGFSLSIALASWKITQFYLLIFSFFLVAAYLFDKHENNSIKNCAMLTAAFCVLTGTLTPYLREGKFLFSLPCLLLYFMAFMPHEGRNFKTKSLMLAGFLLLTACAYSFLLPPSFKSAMYSHVYGMLIYKIKFMLHKPADASLLPPDVRAFWVQPFLSPTLKETADAFALLLPLSVAGCFTLLKFFAQKKASKAHLFLLFFNAAFFIFYIFFTRMRAFLVFFNCLSCVVFLHSLKFDKKSGFVLLCCLVVGAESYHALSQQKSWLTRTLYGISANQPPVKISMPYENELLEAVKKYTRPDDVILTRWALSPMIHAYTGRKIILHAFFESEDIRKKNQQFNELLFADENSLYRQCKTKWHAGILIAARNMTDESTNSERYMANIKNLKPEMAIVKLLQAESKAKHFKLIYENPMYRMFQIVD